ncbi:MAG: hypothetical protein ACI88H_001925 [Cocleimonas sp.]|jgi:hypothetical protein
MLTGLPHQLFISYIKQAGVERRARTTIGLNRGFARSILIRYVTFNIRYKFNSRI